MSTGRVNRGFDRIKLNWNRSAVDGIRGLDSLAATWEQPQRRDRGCWCGDRRSPSFRACPRLSARRISGRRRPGAGLDTDARSDGSAAISAGTDPARIERSVVDASVVDQA